MKGLRARRSDRLLELDEVERRLKPFGRRYLGVREIPLDALVGTVNRASSFTRDFRPLHAFSNDRLRSLEGAFAEGAFPPIVTVKLGEAYFVIDGHHRAALARRAGADMIDADVTEPAQFRATRRRHQRSVTAPEDQPDQRTFGVRVFANHIALRGRRRRVLRVSNSDARRSARRARSSRERGRGSAGCPDWLPARARNQCAPAGSRPGLSPAAAAGIAAPAIFM